VDERDRREEALLAESERVRVALLDMTERLEGFTCDFRIEVARRQHEREQRDGNRATALQAELAGLRQDIDRLGQRIEGLRNDLGRLGDRQSASEGRLKWVALGAVVSVLFALVVGLTVWKVIATDHRVDAICPILALVVGGADPSTRPEGPARDAYIRGMSVMRDGYEQFGCRTIAPLVPPRTTDTHS
jgi:hypothetical protein